LRVTGATCTETVGSLSLDSREHAEKDRREAVASAVMAARKMRADGSRCNQGSSLYPRRTSESSCQSLQIGDGGTIPCLAIVEGIASLRQRVLRVHHFQYRSFSRAIAQIGQTKAVGREIGDPAEP